MNNEDFPALPRNQDSESSPDRDTTSSESTWNTQGILEGFSSPANPARSSNESYSRLDKLRRVNRTYRTRPLIPTPPGETTTGNSKTSTSVNASSNKNQDATREQAEDQSSALSGYSPGRLSKIPTPSPSITTTAKMASFDPDLEHLVVDIMKYDLNHPLAVALQQAYITTFDEFCSIEIADVSNYTLEDSNQVKSKLHNNLVKPIQRGVAYARHKEDINDPDCDDPTQWDAKTYSKWTRNSYVTYLNTIQANALTLANTTIGSTTTTIISTAQKDDDAALISWNRNPRDVAKYPFLKTDADYQDWKLKMKRQLIADTLSRVTESTFSLATCRVGADHELAMLQINFFEQILSAVLINPEGKGLVITHPEDALFVWKQHEEQQNALDSAQISTTALMNKLMTLKIADSPTRHSFLISFQELCNRYDQIANVKLAESFKRTLLQASIMHDTASLNSWNTFNEVKRAVNPLAKPATYSEFIIFLVSQSKTHDIATPYKQSTRHAHKANFDSFSDSNDDFSDDDDSVLDKVMAHMSIQNEPMSEDIVNALQVFSTFQKRRNGPARVRDPEAEIPHPLYSEESKELRIAWSREDSKIKKRILQCKQQAPKQGDKKNAELGVCMIEADGYASESNASAYSEATYGYDADDASADGDISGNEGTDLTVNSAASRQ
jgi:hypothetical protein